MESDDPNKIRYRFLSHIGKIKNSRDNILSEGNNYLLHGDANKIRVVYDEIDKAIKTTEKTKEDLCAVQKKMYDFLKNKESSEGFNL